MLGTLRLPNLVEILKKKYKLLTYDMYESSTPSLTITHSMIRRHLLNTCPSLSLFRCLHEQNLEGYNQGHTGVKGFQMKYDNFFLGGDAEFSVLN